MSLTRQKAFVILFLMLGGLFSLNLFAQTGTATVRGRVTDPSGALVVGATVSLTGGGAKTISAQTDTGGTYELKRVIDGAYTLAVSAAGFEPFEQPGLVVAAGRTSQYDIALTIAVEKQDVTVSDQSNTVDTTSDNNASQLVIKGSTLDAAI
jgi:hypothetical protein